MNPLTLLRRLICPDYARRDGNWQRDRAEVMDYAYHSNYGASLEHAYREGDSPDEPAETAGGKQP